MADLTQTDPNLGGQLRAIDHPHQIALALLAHVLKKPKTWVLAHPECHLSPSQKGELDALINRLELREPLAYLLGNQEFFGLDFFVDPSVLIPRPETELLVEEALLWLKAHPKARRGVDVGTGSGCISVSLISHCPDLSMLATDVSASALHIARKNAQAHNTLDRIDFVACDLLPRPVPQFDLLCANLPYIPSRKLSEVNSLAWEPTLALDGGSDGLLLFRRLFEKILQLPQQPGLILLEIEESLGSQTLELCQSHFPSAAIQLLQDLNGRDRLIRIEAET